MRLFNKTFLTFFFVSVAATAVADTPIFCQVYKDEIQAQAYIVPDGQKPYGALKKEITQLNRDLIDEQNDPNPDAGLIADIQGLINTKEAVLATRIDYRTSINELKRDIRGLEKDKDRAHSEALSLYNEEGLAAANAYCSGFTASPYNCELENQISSDLTAKKSELSTLNENYLLERKWVSRAIAVKESENVFSQEKMTENSATLFGMPLDMGAVGLNKDGDGIKGNLTSNSSQLYSCATDKLTKTIKRPGNIPSVPLFITTSSSHANVDVYFCVRQFLGEGSCSASSQAAEADSGWEGTTLAKNSIDWVSMHNDHIKLKSTCVSADSCRLDVEIIGMGDVDKNNISLKSEQILSQNPSFQKIVDNALSPDYTQAFNTQKQEIHFEDGCVYHSIDAASGTDIEDSVLIQCQGARRDEDGRLVKTIDAQGNTVYDRETVEVGMPLEACPITEVCASEVEEEINYTEGCVSPFPVDEVMMSTNVPEGNCAIKLEKSAYTCTADRVMDTRTCTISRSQSFENCSAKMTTVYHETPVPAIIEDVQGNQVFRMQDDSDIDGYTDFDLSNSLSHSITKKTQNSHKGEGYMTVSQIFREEDIGKYVVFRITNYHHGGDHSEDGFGYRSPRTWGSKSCDNPVSNGSSTHCNKVNWFVINLGDESGGKIEPSTWTPPSDIGNVHEYSRLNSQTVNFGQFQHARNSRRDYGGSPEEYRWGGRTFAVPINSGQPWCSETLDYNLTTDGGSWKMQAPYSLCEVRFTISEEYETRVCDYDDDFNATCYDTLVTGNKQCPDGSTFLVDHKMCVLDGEEAPSYIYNQIVGPTSYCDRVEDGVCQHRFCETDEDWGEQCWYEDYGPYVENLCSIDTDSYNTYDYLASYQSNGVYREGMGSIVRIPESDCQAYESALAQSQACTTGDCSLSAFGWTKPFNTKRVSRGTISRDDMPELHFFNDNQLSEPFTAPNVTFNEFNSFLAPHLEITKTVGSDTAECQSMNALR